MRCVAFIPVLVYLHLDFFYGKEKYTLILLKHCRFEFYYNIQSNPIRTGCTGEEHLTRTTACVRAILGRTGWTGSRGASRGDPTWV